MSYSKRGKLGSRANDRARIPFDKNEMDFNHPNSKAIIFLFVHKVIDIQEDNRFFRKRRSNLIAKCT